MYIYKLCWVNQKIACWVYHPSLGRGPVHRLGSRRSDGPDGIPAHALVSLRVAKMADAFGIERHRIPVHEIGTLKQYKKDLHLPLKTIEQWRDTTINLSKSTQQGTTPLHKLNDHRPIDKLHSNSIRHLIPVSLEDRFTDGDQLQQLLAGLPLGQDQTEGP